jgi:uncharacterized repeat protein (TIGR03803 family)
VNTRKLPSIFRLALLLAAITLTLALRSQAQTETVLYNFTGTDGYGPYASLVFDSAGNLYGTTVIGGTYDAGAVFQLTPTSSGWLETPIYSFTNGNDGANPWSAVVIDAAGNLYGTTYFGGSHSYGTVFRLSPSSTGWQLTVLHTFTGSFDGGNPHAGVILDSAGNLYGTTYFGGRGNGVVFELSPTSTGWKETVLHLFSGQNDGGYPGASLVFDGAGNLYGTTTAGGFNHQGVVFRLSPASSGTWNEAVLHAFTGGKDGAVPWGGLILDPAGNLYGTTLNGGNLTGCSGFGCGTAFKLSPNSTGGWIENVLHTFIGKADGAYPYAGLTLDASGNLYGTTYYGGNLTECAGAGCGNVFELTHPSSGHWTETVLYEFKGGVDGADPYSAPIIDSSGKLYGVAPQFGATRMGVVFEIIP